MLRLSGSSHIFLLKLYNYISRFCCASSFVLSSCPAWQNIYGRKRASERRREAATSSEVSSCTSPIEHLYISQFPFVFRNVFVAAVRVTYFYLPLLLALPLGCRCSCCYYCCFSFCPSPLFVCVSLAFFARHSKWGIRDLSTQFGALVSVPPSQFKLFVCRAAWSSFALVPSATRRKLNPKATTTTTTRFVGRTLGLRMAGNCHRFIVSYHFFCLFARCQLGKGEITEITR